MRPLDTTELSTSIEAEARRADLHLRPHVRETPLIDSSRPGLKLKLEIFQVTGSFKFRGALNRLLAIPEPERGVVTASTGNHGAAVAAGGSLLRIPVRVFVPESVAAPKLARISGTGAQITKISGDPINAEKAARAYASENAIPYVSPYNDPAVVAGQATIGLELLRQCESPPEAIFVPLGGGGLSAGIAIAVKSVLPEVRVIGCSPANSAVMIRSIDAGEILDLPSLPTLSDGTAGGIEHGSITFDLCRAWLDEFVTVSEDEIRASMARVVQEESIMIEGAAAVAVAGYEKRAAQYPGSVILILSGANVSRDLLLGVLGQ